MIFQNLRVRMGDAGVNQIGALVPFGSHVPMDDGESAQARRTLANKMIDKLVDRLPGKTRTQRLALLREAFSEVRHRSFAHSPPVALDASGKPLPPSRGEQVFAEVGDVLLAELAAIFRDGDATTLDG